MEGLTLGGGFGTRSVAFDAVLDVRLDDIDAAAANDMVPIGAPPVDDVAAAAAALFHDLCFVHVRERSDCTLDVLDCTLGVLGVLVQEIQDFSRLALGRGDSAAVVWTHESICAD